MHADHCAQSPRRSFRAGRLIAVCAAAVLSVSATPALAGAAERSSPQPPAQAAAAQTESRQAPGQSEDPLANPPMGWNNWNAFGCDVSAELVKETANIIVEKGLADLGYTHVNIDDCWSAHERDEDGRLVADPEKFPDGIAAVADYVHERGLKLGIYADAGTKTCAGYPGSLGHEEIDAQTFASWEVDLLKYDNCFNEGLPAKDRYRAMAEALDATGRSIVFSICEWGNNRPWEWAPDLGEYWRIDGDITNTWTSVRSIARQLMRVGNDWTGPGFHDPDMLQVGNGGLSPTEERTHFALWALYGAPLILGNDLREISDDSLAVVSNEEIIEVNQEFVGHPVREVSADRGRYALARDMDDESVVVALYNETDTPAAISTTAEAAGLPSADAYDVRDLHEHTNETSTGKFAAQVPARGVVLLRITPTDSPRDGEANPTVTMRAPVLDGAQEFLAGPSGTEVSTTITAPRARKPIRDVTVSLDVPEGWSTEDPTTGRLERLPGGSKHDWTWTLVPGEGAKSQPVKATVAWQGPDGSEGKETVSIELVPVPEAPSGQTTVAELPWLHEWAGYSAPRRNAGIEGQDLEVDGTKYATGVGSHAESEVAVWLGQRCTELSVFVGVQDDTNTGGSVRGVIRGDGAALAGSEEMEIGHPAQRLVVDVSGVDYLQLHTLVGDDSSYGDRIVWGDTELICAGLDISTESDKLVPGDENTITTSLTHIEQDPAEDVEVALGVPQGWQVEASSPSTFAAVAPGETVETTWAVTPPADAEPRQFDVEATARYTVAGESRSISETLQVETIPPPPAGEVFASDHGWVSATNGWGPVERDMANGEQEAGDGPPITLNGVVYDKGLGTHAASRVRYYVDGNCQRFVSDVGLDDAQASRGSVTFAVLADGDEVAASPVMRPDTPTHQIEADIAGARYVDLVVGDAGDGVGNDHADWAAAKFHCSGGGG